MKKLLIIFLLCLMTTSATGQFFAPHQKPNLGLQVNWGHSLSKGLVGCWLFNEGSGGEVFDLSGNRRNCTLNGPVWRPDGVYLDGDDDQFYAVDNPVWTPTKGLTAVAKLTLHTMPPNGNEGIVGHYVGMDSGAIPVNHRSWCLYIGTDGKIMAIASTDGTADLNYKATSTNAVSVGDTFTVAMTWTPSDKVRAYINGVHEGISASSPATLHNCTYPLYIGFQYYEYGHSLQANTLINATIWWVYIYNRALSPSEMAQLYREPFCMFEPSWNWVLYGGISVTPSGQIIFIN